MYYRPSGTGCSYFAVPLLCPVSFFLYLPLSRLETPNPKIYCRVNNASFLLTSIPVSPSSFRRFQPETFFVYYPAAPLTFQAAFFVLFFFPVCVCVCVFLLLCCCGLFQVDGVVVRISSPGGDALASDLMWREVYIPPPKTNEYFFFLFFPFFVFFFLPILFSRPPLLFSLPSPSWS